MRLCALALFVIAATGCNNTDFAGGSAEKQSTDAKRAEQTPDVEPASKTAEPKFSVPANCTPDGVTQADLKTQSVLNNTPGQWIEYEIRVSDCEGKSKTISSNVILFDVNATTDGQITTIPYEVVAGGKKISGFMNAVQGEDLFGKKDPRFFHYRSDQQVTFTVPSTSFTFRIQPGSGRETAMGNAGTAAAAGDQSIQTFLRFGQAAAVTKVVLFKNP